MFGNTKGWLISSLIIVVVSLLIILWGKPPEITPPTKTIPLAMTPVSEALKDADPTGLGIKPADTDGDAHDLYVKVIDDYKENHFKYEEYPSHVAKLWSDKPEFLQWIVEAGDCKKASVFSKNPQLIISYDNVLDPLDALEKTGGMTNGLGLYLVADAISKKKEIPPDADKYLNAAFLLGERMFYERLRFEELRVGDELMSDAAFGLEKEAVYKQDKARAAQIEAFVNAIKSYDQKVLSTWQAISGIGGDTLSNAGDIFDVAENSKEPMWRIEAMLKLGRMHYMNNVTAADQRGAVRVLKRMADDADSFPLRTAAEKARDLKVEDFRMIGGGT